MSRTTELPTELLNMYCGIEQVIMAAAAMIAAGRHPTYG